MNDGGFKVKECRPWLNDGGLKGVDHGWMTAGLNLKKQTMGG